MKAVQAQLGMQPGVELGLVLPRSFAPMLRYFLLRDGSVEMEAADVNAVTRFLRSMELAAQSENGKVADLVAKNTNLGRELVDARRELIEARVPRGVPLDIPLDGFYEYTRTGKVPFRDGSPLFGSIPHPRVGRSVRRGKSMTLPFSTASSSSASSSSSSSSSASPALGG